MNITIQMAFSFVTQHTKNIVRMRVKLGNWGHERLLKGNKSRKVANVNVL